ncbi:MAG: hypothetical protein WC223_12510 [Bacteroidales bacterium]|jgi:hypothetical protein
MRKKIENIGNPVLVATALAPAIKENAPVIIKTSANFIKTFLIILGVSGTLFFGYKWAAAKRRKQLEAKAGQDADIKAAIDIYNAIPAGLKKGEGSLWNPFGFVTDIANKIATIWQKTDTDRILDISKRIKDNKRVFKVFRILYNEDLYQLLSKVLSTSDLDLFTAHSGPTHSSSVTPAIPKNNIVISTKTVNVRKTPLNQEGVYSNSSVWNKIKNLSSEVIRRYTQSNIIATVDNDKFLGITTGREVTDEEGKTVFTEVLGIKKGGSKWDTTIYVWKGAIRTLTKEQATKEFGTLKTLITNKAFFIDPAKLSGLDDESVIIKSVAKATIYDEQMKPLSTVDKNYALGRVTGSLNTGERVYVKFFTVNGTERYIDKRFVEAI